ncbi:MULTISPECIES: urea ABC transporter permease subunit UrtB [unclassified Chelatococcus]|uniref:urea ABC transporter permease subunit UrtB n=1 Tax=unclassified Chelatococcus TaxID=2638111 RepID=UPI001BCC15FE|nr:MULTISPECIES: urea ABC transporter permease subunit UrtB [unclassified Chelatococcus]CAH1669833.1 Urea ABC transporter, permease protein UrtB [Hyphomicrobiales bacterium]MBS7739283.1 urea ABC transporter permease subunit UrtB [Chelatococcus sp. HY11]MBX3546562.1 urea ABC transporter permease subunit UrtB [Chelatococcus sp.]MCO5076184.1 urea ABC transporter permease subunit UrtB [Chelatococcus sp.]CAH1678722.1 Urea ABC transporter, permease protein UrtB [Hyphomicrobiales bacterium]
MSSLIRLLSLLGILVAAIVQPALAQETRAAFATLATDNYGDIEKGVAAVAESGAPTAEAVLNALGDNRLLYRPSDKAVFYRDASGTFRDAATGDAVTPAPTGLRPVRLNNRVRRAVEAAVGTLTLMSPEASKRRQAAEAVFRSRDAATLPALAKAIATERDSSVKQALLQAQAAIFLTADGIADADRIAAVDIVAARGDQDARSMLTQVAGRGSPVLKLAADTAIAAIDRRLAIAATVQNIWYGLSLGSVLLLAAIGLAITFGVMGIINMAHGEMVMIGAYTTFVVQEICRTRFPGLFDWSLPVALPLAFLVAGGVGALIERLVIRHLYGRPLETLLATWGISLILQQAVRSIFGPTNREVGAPSYMAGAFDVLGVTITYGRLWIVIFSLCVFLGLIAVLKLTPFGLRMRAVTQNRRMASAMGIRTPRVDMLAFALGSGIAGVAGVALSQIDNVSPNLGQSYIIDSFMVVVFGGVGNLWGTFVSALTLGVANKFLEPYAGAVLGKILLLVFLILFIQKRPRGLFALKGRSVEA